jgi:general secretion pathway protein H
MRTSAPGSKARAVRRPGAAGFTLIELLVVLAIIAIATAGVTLALRDGSDTQLDREAQRLSALFESARAQSRSSGAPVVWHAVEGGFRFEGVPEGALPDRWLNATTVIYGNGRIVLGPEPIIGPQAVVLGSSASPQRSLRIATDGLRPFTVNDGAAP